MAKTTWKIDPAHTTVEFAVKHMMFTTVRGRFTQLEGTIEVDDQNPERSHVEVVIDATSIDTGNADRDKHLRSADFLDVESQPKLRFTSASAQGAAKKEGDRFRVTGELEIRGKQVPVTLECTYNGQGKDPWGGTRAGFNARTEIDRRDWGLTWNAALESGGILVANEVKIELDVQAVLQQQAGKAAA